MPIKHLNEDGTEVDVYTADELAAEKSARELAEGRVGELTNDLVNLKRGHKAEVKRIEDMTTEELGRLTDEQKANMQRIQDLEDARKHDLESTKEALFDRASNNDPKVKEKLKEKFALIQMPEGTAAEIAEKLQAVSGWAYAELGITVNQPPINPLLGGSPPNAGSNEDKPFHQTERGQALEKELFGDLLPQDNK